MISRSSTIAGINFRSKIWVVSLVVCLGFIFPDPLSSFGQSIQREVAYGNNPQAGKYYSVPGISIYAEIYGKGRPLLLLHGNGGNLDAFSKNIPFLARRYRVVAMDSRSQGKSIDNGDSLSFEMMADDCAALLEDLKIDSCFVAGWSDGGIVALLLAIRHPGKVIALAASGANLWPDSTAVDPSGWLEDQKRYDAGKNKIRTTVEEKNKWKIFLLDWFQPNIRLTDLHTIHCPALIISGDHDAINLEHSVQIFKAIPNARLWVLPNTGHATLRQQPEEFDKQVDFFFRSCNHDNKE